MLITEISVGSFNQYESMSNEKEGGNKATGEVRAGDYKIKYACVSQRGHYPDQPFKANQDAVLVKPDVIGGGGDHHLFAVFDGHGECGAETAFFCKSKLPQVLAEDAGALRADPPAAIHDALIKVNSQLHESLFDDSLSGTTACVVYVNGSELVVSNVGDSRCVLAVKNGGGVKAKDLSWDQTPFVDSEVERVEQAGARVLTLGQMEGDKPLGKIWTNEMDCDGDPPRLWVKDGFYPGTAFTRSLGDSIAKSIGVTADSEDIVHKLGADDAFVVLATDGVWEFISSQRAVEMVDKHGENLMGAATALCAESYRLWLSEEKRTDDITVCVMKFSRQ
jgi:serine/threonine protein phosphatase PrpC